MLFGKRFRVIREFPRVFRLIGDSYPEYFIAYGEHGQLYYGIFDDGFGQPSPANFDDSPYAKKLRTRSEEILRDLVKEGYIVEVRK